MKVVIGFILIFVGATSAIDDRKLTLDEWFAAVNARHPRVAQGHPFYSQLYEINGKVYCIKDALNIYNYGKKQVNFADAMILIYGAGINCLQSKDNAWKLLIKALIDHYATSIPRNKECFALELKRIEPNAAVLYNFNAANVNIDEAECEDLVDIAGFSDFIKDVENTFGSLNELTCGAVDEDKIKRHFLNFIVLASGIVGDYTESYTNYQARQTKQMLDDAFECVKSRMFASGHQWISPTATVRTTTRAITRATARATQDTQSTYTNINTNSANRVRPDGLTGEKVYWYDRDAYFDVHLYYGKKYLRSNNQWVEITNNEQFVLYRN